jgi:sigma-E factor negative regulatory protein RseA
MTQNISTLMDGELYGDETDQLLRKIKLNREAQQDWQTYHLIGDVLRQSDYLPRSMSASFFERLEAEPTILAPQRPRSSKVGIVVMSAAASIMAMAFVGWLSIQISTEPVAVQAQVNTKVMRTARLPSSANFPTNGSMNDYLLAHEEFSPGTDVRGASSYIRSVSTRQGMTVNDVR